MARRSLITFAIALVALTPLAAPAQGTMNDVRVEEIFFARFDIPEENRVVVISGKVTTTAFLVFFPPDAPLEHEDRSTSACVTIHNANTMNVVDEACGDWTVAVDPTLSIATFAGQLPSDDGTMTAAVTFVGTGVPTEPAPIVVAPPFTTVDMRIDREATATGVAFNDQGQGFDTPLTSSAAELALKTLVLSSVFV